MAWTDIARQEHRRLAPNPSHISLIFGGAISALWRGVHGAMSDGAIFEHMIDPSGGDGVHRLDVVVSPGGRRRWSPDVKARIISESLFAVT